MSSEPEEKDKIEQTPEQRFSLYLGWCKRCGHCVAFCPTGALEKDEWGYPFMAHPEKCTACHMCEYLCPDFAISVRDESSAHIAAAGRTGPAPGEPGSRVSLRDSPERLAPEPAQDEDDDE